MKRADESGNILHRTLSRVATARRESVSWKQLEGDPDERILVRTTTTTTLQNVKLRLFGEADGAVKMDALDEDVALGRDDAGTAEGVDGQGKIRPVDD